MDAEVKQVKSVCPYCGVGCGIVMQVEDNRVIRVSGDKQHPANQGKLCTKGLTCAAALNAAGRLTQAFLRTDRQQDPVQTEITVAISETARRLKAIIARHGPGAVAMYVSADTGNHSSRLHIQACLYLLIITGENRIILLPSALL